MRILRPYCEQILLDVIARGRIANLAAGDAELVQVIFSLIGTVVMSGRDLPRPMSRGIG